MKMLLLMSFLLLSVAEVKLTIEELKKYDGSYGITYIACGGLVFDVSNSPAYHSSGIYGKFAGHDVSASLGK